MSAPARCLGALLLGTIPTLAGQPVGAQDPAAGQDTMPPRVAERAIFVGSEFPSFPDLKIDGSDLLEGSIKIEDKGAKITYAPLLLAKRYTEVLSETRFQLGQKDKVTTLGVSLTFNPLSPRGRRGRGIWEATEESSAMRANVELLNTYEEALDSLEHAYSRLHPGLSQLADSIQDLMDDEIFAKGEELERIQRELAKMRGRRAAMLRAAEASLARQNPFAASERLARLAAIERRISELGTLVDNAFAADVLNFSASLFRPAPPVIGLSYSRSFFSVIGGDFVDADEDGLDDNGERLQGQAVSLSLDWRWSERGQLSGLLSYGEERGSAEQDTELEESLKVAFTLGHVLAILDSDYAKTKEYRESLFVPSLVLGLAFSGSFCQKEGDVGCGKDDVVRDLTFTPFLDFKLRKASQFRIGVPITRRVKANDEGGITELGITTLISLQLGS